MNRRHKKKPQQVDHLALLQQKLALIEWKACWKNVVSFFRTLPVLHQRSIIVLILLVCLVFFVPFSGKEVSSERINVNINTDVLTEARPELTEESVPGWKNYTVKTGDTLIQIFRNNKLSITDINPLIKVEGEDKPLSQIKVGQLIRFKFKDNDKSELDIIQLEKDEKSVMFFKQADGSFARSN